MKLTYLGPAKTYSERAAQLMIGRLPSPIELYPLPSPEAVAHSLLPDSATRAQWAVLPYYNFLDGLVQECLDLIYENHLYIIDAQRVPVLWSLGMSPTNDEYNIIYSHPKALAQCSTYLWNHYPQARMLAVASTADGARTVRECGRGLAIASQEALLGEDLQIIAEDIGKVRHGRGNFTDFYLISATDNKTGDYDPARQYLTMMAVTPSTDRPGLLAGILTLIADYKLNNAKIHSRPAIDDVHTDVEPQMFYLEVMCHQRHPEFIECLNKIRAFLAAPEDQDDVVRVLGSYPRPLSA